MRRFCGLAAGVMLGLLLGTTTPACADDAAALTRPEVQALIQQAQQASDKRDWNNAQRLDRDALAKAEMLNDEAGKARALLSLAIDIFNHAMTEDQPRLLEKQVRLPMAVEYGEKAIPLFQKIGDYRRGLYARYIVARCRTKMDALPETIIRELNDIARQASALPEAKRDRSLETVYWEQLSVAYTLNYQMSDAVRVDKILIELLRKMPDSQLQLAGRLYHAAGLLMNLAGKPEDINKLLDEALELCDRGGTQAAQQKAKIQLMMGQYHAIHGESARAQALFQEALVYFRAHEDKANIMAILVEIAGYYVAVNHQREAATFFQQAWEARGTDLNVNFSVLNAMQQNFAVLESLAPTQAEKADWKNRQLETWEKLRPLLQDMLKATSPSDRAFAYTQFGRLEVGVGSNAEALEHLTEALRIETTYNLLGMQTGTLGMMALVQRKMEQWEPALNTLQHQMQAEQQLGIAISFPTLHDVAECHSRLKQYATAQHFFEAALDAYEAEATQTQDPVHAGQYYGPLGRALYLDYAQMLIAQHRIGDALAAWERYRARGMASQAAQNRVAWSELSANERAKWEQANEELALRNGQRRRSLDQAAIVRSEAENARIKQAAQEAEQEWEKAEQRFLSMRAALIQKYPRFAAANAVKPLVFADLQALARKDKTAQNTLYIEYAVGREQGYVFALTAQGVQKFPIPGEKRLTELVSAWRNSVLTTFNAQSLADEAKTAQSLYHVLLEPLEAAGLLHPAPGKRLVFVADGPLLDLSFLALRDAQGRRLIERFPISSAIGLNTLAWPDNRQHTGRGLCYAIEALPDIHAVKTGQPYFPPLTDMRTAARNMRRAYEGDAINVVDISRAAQAGELNPYSILVFVAHGDLDPNNGLNSSLVFAQAPGAQDGYIRLKARTIAGLQLSADLALLMACDTGEGQQGGGDGLLGLTWSFQAARTRSVLASQWKVATAPTGKLLTLFLTALKAKAPKDIALRDAVLALRKDLAWQSPRFWAAFQFYGDVSALPAVSFAAPLKPAAPQQARH